MILETKQDVLMLPWEYIKTGRLPTKNKKVAGVYILRNLYNSAIDYIGQSTNIGHRLLDHHHAELKYCQNHTLFILRVEDKATRLYIEARSIYLFNPRFNQRSGIGLKLSDGELTRGYTEVFG